MATKLPILLAAIATLASATAAGAMPIEPRAVTWNIVSDRDMSRLCRDHGMRPNCEGMATWDKEFRMCIIWTRSPRGADDTSGWQVIHHELQHCQEGQFHH